MRWMEKGEGEGEGEGGKRRGGVGKRRVLKIASRFHQKQTAAQHHEIDIRFRRGESRITTRPRPEQRSTTRMFPSFRIVVPLTFP